MAQRFWTCRKCAKRHPRLKQKCSCGASRPTRRTASERALADPYELWVAEFGDRCGICGKEASERRRLDRDHDHASLRKRGLLCSRCNRALPAWMTDDWLEKALEYLRRAA